MDALKRQITEKIKEIVDDSDKNNLHGFDEKSWEEPMVAFASGSDPLFSFYKEHIGDFYWSPDEVMAIEYGKEFDISKLSIVCWILPQTEATILDQRKETELPSERWVYSRHYGEAFNQFLRAEVVSFIRGLGINAASALITEGFGYQHSEKVGICSNWSERHTAYAAGLGTFSLSDGFITAKGKAHRVGSAIFEKIVEPDVRNNKSHTENCLYYAKGTCGACIKRCPADAISKEGGHDKQACHDYIRATTMPYATKILGAEQTPCGLCQVKVPCERINPTARTRTS